MHSVFVNTFGGLSRQYFFRQFMFGLLFPVFVYAMLSRNPSGIPMTMYVLLAVNTLLYPYSRFVYEGIVDFVVGENVFIVNAFVMLMAKLMTMLLCWCFAIFVAPVGLAYLYYHHSKSAR